MKKLIATVALAGVAVFGIAACGSGSSSSAHKPLSDSQALQNALRDAQATSVPTTQPPVTSPNLWTPEIEQTFWSHFVASAPTTHTYDRACVLNVVERNYPDPTSLLGIASAGPTGAETQNVDRQIVDAGCVK